MFIDYLLFLTPCFYTRYDTSYSCGYHTKTD